MADQISNYRQIRLTITPSEVSTTVLWDVAAIEVKRGLARREGLASGRLEGSMPASVRAAYSLLEAALDHLCDELFPEDLEVE